MYIFLEQGIKYKEIIAICYRARHENAKSIDNVAEIQERCNIPQHQIDAGEGDCGSRHTSCVRALLLGSIGLAVNSFGFVLYLNIGNGISGKYFAIQY